MTSAAGAWPLLEGSRRAGLDVPALLRSVGLGSVDLGDPDTRFDGLLYLRLWEEAAGRSGDPNFGLHVAEHQLCGSQDIIDYLVSSSSTIEEALRRYMRYYRLLSDMAFIELVEDRATVRIRNELPLLEGRAPRHLGEASMCFWVRYVRSLVIGELPLLEVRFMHSQPSSISEHARLFQVPVRFGHPANQLILDRSFLTQQIKTADSRLAAILDRYAKAMLERLPARDQFLDQVRWALAQSLRGSEPTLQSVARRLAMSKRTLQRRLAGASSSLAVLSQDVRRNLAFAYLEDARLSITEVSFLLGFSSLSGFYRAFKAWTGRTPTEYRNSARASK